MNRTSKQKFNGRYVIAGACCLICLLFFNQAHIYSSELAQVKLTVSSFRTLHGRTKDAARFTSREYNRGFKLDNVAGEAAGWDLDEKLGEGDQLVIEIAQQSVGSLQSSGEPIAAFSLRKEGEILFDTEKYNLTGKLKNRRYLVIFGFIGIILLARGLNIFPRKGLWAICAAAAILIIISRVLRVWLWA